MTQHLCLLALFFDAKGEIRSQTDQAEADKTVARRLRQLAEKLRPGSSKN